MSFYAYREMSAKSEMDPGIYVIIEADTGFDADNKAEELGMGLEPNALTTQKYMAIGGKEDEPAIHGRNVHEHADLYNQAVIYYADGTVIVTQSPKVQEGF